MPFGSSVMFIASFFMRDSISAELKMGRNNKVSNPPSFSFGKRKFFKSDAGGTETRLKAVSLRLDGRSAVFSKGMQMYSALGQRFQAKLCQYRKLNFTSELPNAKVLWKFSVPKY